MARKSDWGSGIPSIPENSRLMRTHETMVDLISGRATSFTLIDGLKSLFGFGIDNEDDEYFDDYYDEKQQDKKTYCGFSENFLGHGASKPIAPHPRIKQLTPEEAERHAQELLKEEEKFKEKTEKKRLKKLRQRERKRLQKDNEIKDKDVLDGEPGKSTSSDANVNIQSKGDITESLVPESGTMENKTEVDAAPEESCGFKKDYQEEEVEEARKPVDLDRKPELDMSTCFVSTAACIAKPKLEQKAKAEKKEKKINIFQQPLEEKGKVLEQQQEINNTEEKQMEANVEDIVKRSTELALIGNQFAACGQLELAVKYFTDAIKHNPKEYRLFGNRSLCYEKMQLYENALIDADLALSMQPGWIKGLFRQGKALSGLKRYYEAAVTYKEVLKLDSLCTDASQELMRVQTFQLMEMGFTHEQSSNALMAFSFEKAIDVLSGIEVGTASNNLAVANTPQPSQEWVVLQKTTAKSGPNTLSTAPTQTRPKPKATTPVPSDRVKPELFSIWIGSLVPTVTEAMIHSLFSRAGVIQSVRMLLECHCAFVNYFRKEDCESAIQMMHGMVLEGSTILVRHPDRINQKPVSKFTVTKPDISVEPPTNSNNMECFFWRTTGCIKKERCTYRHVQAHKNIDREPSKFKTTPQ